MRNIRVYIGNIFIVTFFLCRTACFAQTAAARYISLAPSTTEILFALGLEDQVVGVSSFCDYPPQARKKEIVGTFSLPNIEKILSLKPDIVFCTGLEQAPAVADLSRTGAKIYVSHPSNISEVFDSINEIGVLVNREKEAQELVNRMKQEIEEISAEVRLIPEDKRPAVFIEYWASPLMTAGKGSFINELIVLAGGRNIAGDSPKPYGSFSPEEVIRRDPDCIILAYMVNQDAGKILRQRMGWGKIKAVINNCVYSDIDPNILLRPGPRIVEGLKEIHKRLYKQ